MRWKANRSSLWAPKRGAGVGITCVMALLLGACGVDVDVGSGLSCIMGPCGDGSSGYSSETYVIGFPFEKASTTHSTGGYWGSVGVADTIRLYLVRAPAFLSPTPAPPDTVRQVTWTVSESSVATISPGHSGEGIFVGRNPGRTHVLANGQFFTLWACNGNGCLRISEIEVLPQ
jgi:hypothetical protein